MLYRPTAESQVMIMNNDCRVDDVCSEEMNGDVSEIGLGALFSRAVVPQQFCLELCNSTC